MSHRPQNVLVTGGAGFIGANHVRWLLQNDRSVSVVNLDSLTYAGSMENLAGVDASRHTFVQGDIRDGALVAKILRAHEIDTIVHFAAESHVDRSIDGPAAFVLTNVVGTFTLLEAARQYWLVEKKLNGRSVRFHHVSTDEVYGSLGPTDPAFSEKTPYDPSSPYSASKAGSDHLVRAYQHTYGLDCTISNCSNNYGPLQHTEKFIPTVIRACLERRPIPVYGNGSNVRDWLYVGDHCEAIDRIVREGKSGETFNVGGLNERANIDVARTICRIMDELVPVGAPRESLITFVKDRPGHDWRYAIDATRIRERLGWTPKETFETGLARTVRWYVDRAAQAGRAHALAAG